jgi:hypothetical protein
MDVLAGYKLITACLIAIAVIAFRAIYGDITIGDTMLPAMEFPEAIDHIWKYIMIIFGKAAWNRHTNGKSNGP